MKIEARSSFLIALFVSLIILPSCGRLFDNDTPDFSSSSYEEHTIEPGHVFQHGSFIEFEGVKILYSGDGFSITNSNTYDVTIALKIVGVKSDGSYTLLQMPAFNGPNEAQYKEDMAENGWAVMSRTNCVRSGETLYAVAEIFDLSSHGYTAPDIDGDGYYDVIFVISPQKSADKITASFSDLETPIYRLKA